MEGTGTVTVGNSRSTARQWAKHDFAVTEGRDRQRYFLCKRGLDLVIAATIVLVFTPLMLLIGALIKLDTRGPVFFVQERVGVKRRSRKEHAEWEICTFPCYKFRSMIHGADQSQHQALAEAFVEGRIGDKPGTVVKLVDDARVTRVGRVLRKTSLDELPQLFNVLRGEMSLVGPRPVPTYEAAKYQIHHWQRLTALPGITGWWQIKGRGQVSFETMMEMDLDYIQHQSLWLDLKLLTLTIPAIFSRRGAH
ncbi:MAG: sugar transferase [Candidatus Binatia bacterium]